MLQCVAVRCSVLQCVAVYVVNECNHAGLPRAAHGRARCVLQLYAVCTGVLYAVFLRVL